MDFITEAMERYGPLAQSWVTVHFVPTLNQLYGLGAVLVVALAFVGFGAVAGGRRRLMAADLVCGWGLVSLVFTLIGVFTPAPFTPVVIVLGFIAIPALVWTTFRDGQTLAPGAGKVLFLAAPLFLLTAAMTPSQWDEFSHWLLAGQYLFEMDVFPAADLPRPLADYPAYPYGVPLITYLASRVTGFFIENAGPLFNLLLMFSFSLAVIGMIRRALGRPEDQEFTWGLAALAALSVTIFNPTFVQKIILTAYADLPSAVAVGFAGVLGWTMLEDLSRRDSRSAAKTALQMGLALAALVNAKQATLVLFVFLVVGVILAGIRDPKVKFWRLLTVLPLVVGPAVIIYGAWNLHVYENLQGSAPAIRPYELWNFHLVSQIAASMLNVMLHKGAYFALALLVFFFGLRGMIRFNGPFDRLAIIAATVFGGYNAFLFFAYLAIFGGSESANAASYWRYNMHLGFLGIAFGAYGLALLWRRYVKKRVTALPAALAVLLVLALPFVFAQKLRFDLVLPKQFVRSIGNELAGSLPVDSTVLVVDVWEPGFYAKMMRYLLYGTATQVADIKIHHKFNAKDMRRFVAKHKPEYIWIHTQNAAVVEAFRLPLKEKNAHLLRRKGEGWELLKSWPYPGYRLPQDVPD